MNYKGILLAGGEGKRLYPITKAINKHFLPIHDKPMIFYSLSILFLCKIKKILIICREEDIEDYKNFLGDGSRFGVSLSFVIQNTPKGIPDAFIIGEKFIGKSKVALVLGDNFFFGHQISEKLINVKLKNINCTIFVYPINDPSSYGVIEYNKKKIKPIREKPKKTNSNLAITGLYFFDNDVSKYAKKLKPSKRNEIEIVDLLNMYRKKNKLKIEYLGRGSAWLDAGSFENLEKASFFVKNIENRQGLKIACLEEIASNNNWIKIKDIEKSIPFYGDTNYAKYLKKLIKNK